MGLQKRDSLLIFSMLNMNQKNKKIIRKELITRPLTRASMALTAVSKVI